MPIDIKQLLALLQQGAPQQGAPKPPGPMDHFNQITMPQAVPQQAGQQAPPPSPMQRPQHPAPPAQNDYMDRQMILDHLRHKQGRSYKNVFGNVMDSSEAKGPLAAILAGQPEEARKSSKDLLFRMQKESGDVSLFGDKMNLPPYQKDRQQLDDLLSRIGPAPLGNVPELLSGGGLKEPPESGPDEMPMQGLSPVGTQGATPKKEGLFDRLDAERGFTNKPIQGAPSFAPNVTEKDLKSAQNFGPIGQMFTDAASEVMQRGADSPDKADDLLRSEFQDDPEIESAIADARQRYEIARARSAKPPGVMEYVGYVLSTLAGANPMQAAEAISRRGEKREDEHRALQDLLGAQGMKVKDRQMQRQLGNQAGIANAKITQDQQEGAARQQNRAEDKNFDRLKAGRGAALQRMNQLQQAVNMSNNPAEKKALQDELNMLKRRTQLFGRQLGEPEQDEQGRPIGAASPDAMRLLGLG